MDSLNVSHTESRQNLGWVPVFGVALLQALSATFLLAFSGPGTFESDTGVRWDELVSVFPTVADQFTGAQQASGVRLWACFLPSSASPFTPVVLIPGIWKEPALLVSLEQAHF